MLLDPKAAEPQLAIAVALYAKGDRDQGLTLGQTALELDGRYGNLEFLEENLWGTKLLNQAKMLLDTPKMQETMAQSQTQPSNEN